MAKITAMLMSIIITLFSFFGLPTDKIYSKRKLDKALLEKNIANRVNDDITDGKLTGIEAIVYQNNECVLSKTFGKKSSEGEALQENELFRIASMTKPITAVAVLLEAEKGNIDIYANVSDYIDGFGEMTVGKIENGEVVTTGKAKNSIKVYQLLSHSSGIASGELENMYYSMFAKENPEYDIAYVTHRLSELPLMYDPGTSQAYTSVAFDVAARIVEVTSGMAFEEYIKTNIFDKLEMTDTTFHPDEQQWQRMVATHARTDDGKAYDYPMSMQSVFGNFPAEYAMAGGGLASTAQDYIKFAQMLLNNGKAANGTQVMSENSVALMKTPAVDAKIMPGNARWGLGVIVYINSKGTLPKDSFGWSGAYGTHFFIDPSDKVTAVYMKNSVYEGGAGCRTANNFEKDIFASFVWNFK